MHTRRSARPGSRELPLRLRQAARRARSSRIAWSPDALHAEGCRAADRAHSLGRGTFVAGRRRGDCVDSSLERTHAQPREELESPPRAGSIFGQMQDFSFNTAAHRCAQVEIETLHTRLRRSIARDLKPLRATVMSALQNREQELTTAIPERIHNSYSPSLSSSLSSTGSLGRSERMRSPRKPGVLSASSSKISTTFLAHSCSSWSLLRAG